MIRSVAALLALASTPGCGETHCVCGALPRVLETDQVLYDAGVVRPGAEVDVPITLLSTGLAPVVLFDVALEDGADPAFSVVEGWTNDTLVFHDGREDDVLYIEGTNEGVPTTAAVNLRFHPRQPGAHRATVLFESNDNEVVENDPETGRSVWRVVVRGFARSLSADLEQTEDADRDGFTVEEGDCDDADPWSWPGAPEDCDEVDNDCDGRVDEDEREAREGACDYVAERASG